MTSIEAMCAAAELHLRRSIGTSAGIHKAKLRELAAAIRAELVLGPVCGQDCACLTDCGDFYAANGMPLPRGCTAIIAEPPRRSAWPFQVGHANAR
jgi:hypothetical protein